MLRPFSNPGPGNLTFLLSLSMVGIFLGLGFLFLVTDTWIDTYPKPTRYYIGGVLVGWAVFRAITSWFRYKRMKKEEEEDERY